MIIHAALMFEDHLLMASDDPMDGNFGPVQGMKVSYSAPDAEAARGCSTRWPKAGRSRRSSSRRSSRPCSACAPTSSAPRGWSARPTRTRRPDESNHGPRGWVPKVDGPRRWNSSAAVSCAMRRAHTVLHRTTVVHTRDRATSSRDPELARTLSVWIRLAVPADGRSHRHRAIQWSHGRRVPRRDQQLARDQSAARSPLRPARALDRRRDARHRRHRRTPPRRSTKRRRRIRPRHRHVETTTTHTRRCDLSVSRSVDRLAGDRVGRQRRLRLHAQHST